MNFVPVSSGRWGTMAIAILALWMPICSYAADAFKAVIKAPSTAYSGQPVVLDGSKSASGDGVSYAWTVEGATVENGNQAIAKFIPPSMKHWKVCLSVSRGGEQKEAKTVVASINDPTKDDSPSFAGARKILYKEAPDALGGMAKLYLHVFQPDGWKASDRRAVVILFHGGGWSGGSPDRYEADSRYWASRGIVGITAQYRLGQREGTQPQDCVADARSAVRYVRSHATEMGIDPEKIAVGGESAGAHIAACTGTLETYNDPADNLSVRCVPNAMILYFPYSLVTDRGNRRDDMSPLHFVNASTPATLIIGGEMDRIAPVERCIEWGEKMKGSKNPFRLFIYRKAHHPSGTPDMNKPGVGNDIVRQSDLFLASLGWTKGEPTVAKMSPDAVEKLHMDPPEFHPPAAK